MYIINLKLEWRKFFLKNNFIYYNLVDNWKYWFLLCDFNFC